MKNKKADDNIFKLKANVTSMNLHFLICYYLTMQLYWESKIVQFSVREPNLVDSKSA